jgi:uncharacterized membrane protein
VSTEIRDRLVDTYLAELRGAAGGMPRSRRRELLAQVEEHLSEAIPADATEAQARTEFDRLGDPEQIVGEARERSKSSHATGDTFEWVAVGLIVIGGFVIPVLGWVIGVMMLWASRVWTVRDKLVGTLLVPGGVWTVIILVRVAGARGGLITPGVGLAVWAYSLVASIIIAIYLGRRISRREAS